MLLEMMDSEYARLRIEFEQKALDYAGDDDAIADFKEIAAELDISVLRVWQVYAIKHWRAIGAFCHGETESEPIRKRVGDLMGYGFLLLALIEDANGQEQLRPERTVA